MPAPTDPDWKSLFPSLTSGRIHLNHAAVSPLPAASVRAIEQYAREASEEVGAEYELRFQRVRDVRAAAAKLIGALPEEICFTKSTTHGLLIVAHSINWQEGDAIVVEETAFPANWYVWKSLEKRFGVKVLVWKERNFRYELDEVREMFTQHRVRLVALCSADFATGFRHYMAAVGKACRAAGVMLCIDAIQTLGAWPFDVNACQADFVSADGHKWMLGPEGTGFLYVRKARLPELNDSMVGWLGRDGFMDMEAKNLGPAKSARRFEEGCLNMVGIYALGASLDLLNKFGPEKVRENIRANTRYLREEMEALGWDLISPSEGAHDCGILAFRHPALDADDVVGRLEAERVICSSRRGFLRLSPHFYQDPGLMEEFISRLASAVRSISR